MEPASPRERQSVAPPPSSFSSSRPVLSHRRSSSSSTNSIHNRHASFSNDISILDETQPAEPLSSRRLSARLSINASPSSASSTSSHSSRHHSSSDQQNPSSTLKRGTARRASLLQHGLPSPPFTSSDGSGSTRNPPLASELASFQAQSSTDLSPLTLSRRESEKEREEVERQTALSRRDSSSRSSNGSRGSLDFGSRKRSQSPRRSRHPSRTSLVASEEETERSNGARSSSNRRSSNGGSSSFSGFGAEGRTSRTPQDDYPLPPSLTSTRHDRRGSTSSGSSLHAPSRSSLDAGVSPRSSSPLSNQERDPPSSLRTRAVLNRTNTNTSTNSYQSAATSSSSSSSSSSLSRPTSSDHAKRPSLSSRPSETNSISSFHTATSRVRPSPLIPSSPGRPYSPAALASPTASRLRVSPSVRSTRTPLSASTSTLRNKRTTSETSPSLNSLSASTSTARSRRSQALSQHSTPSRDADLASPFTSPRDPREEGRRSLAFENERREVEEAKDEPRARTASGGRSRGRIPVEFTAESGVSGFQSIPMLRIVLFADRYLCSNSQSRASHHAPSPSIGRDSSTPQRPPRRQTLPPFHPPRDGHDEVDSNPSLTLNLNRHDGSSFSNRRSTRTNAPYRAEPLRESGTQPRYLGRGGSAESALANSSTSTIRREEFAFSGRGSDGGHYSPAGTVVNRTRELLERIERENAEAERKRRELAENQAIKRAESSMSFHSSTSQSTTTGATTTRADIDRRFPPRTPGRAYEGSRGDGPRTVGTQPRRPQTVMSFVEDVAAAIPPRTAPPAAIHGGLRSHRSIYNLQSSAEEAPSPSGHLSRSRSTRAATPERFSTMAIRHQHAPLTSSTTRRPMTSMDYVSNGGGSIAMSPSISSFSSITSANIPPPSTSSGSDHHIRTLHSAFTHLSTHYSLSPLPSSPQILSAAQTLLSSATETHQALLHASRLAREQLIDVQVNGVADEVVEGMGVLSGLLKDAVRANDEEVRSLTRLLIALPKVAREAAAGARGGEGPTDDGRSVGRGHERLSSVDERTLSGGGSIRRSGSLRSGMEHGRESSTSGTSVSLPLLPDRQLMLRPFLFPCTQQDPAGSTQAITTLDLRHRKATPLLQRPVFGTILPPLLIIIITSPLQPLQRTLRIGRTDSRPSPDPLLPSMSETPLHQR
jgi:hypothetical protein